MNAYFISGLGADKRIFSKLSIDKSINIIHLDWITPIKNETLSHYAQRLSENIDTSTSFALVGVSFGGMIAVEISKILLPKVTIIISSVSKSNQLPLLYRLAGKIRLIDFLPTSLLKLNNQYILAYLFGTKSHGDKKLLNNIIKDTDSKFLKWAIASILKWKNSILPKNLYHIHGTDDKILKFKKSTPDFTVENGTHFMVFQKSKEISAILNSLLKE